MSGRLGVLIPEFPGQTHAFFWREIRAIEAAGCPVEILSTRRPAKEDCRHAFAEEARARTHYLYPPAMGPAAIELVRRLHRLPRPLRYIVGLRESTWRERAGVAAMGLCSLDLAAHARKAGIRHIHVHSCNQAAHIVAMAHALGGPTYSLHLHGDLPVYGKDHASKMRHAAFVSADARPMEQQAASVEGMTADRALTCWMGVETDHMAPPPARNGAGPLRVVTVARLNRTKGHEVALQGFAAALDRGAEGHYTIAGVGPWEEQIRARVKDLGVGAHVTFTGTLGEGEVLRTLHESDVFVLASVGQGEASPVAVMEAMSTGLPVICSRIGGTPQMINDGEDGFLVDQGDSDRIADLLVALYSDPDRRRVIGERARKRAVEFFDVRHTARRLLGAVNRHRVGAGELGAA